MASGFEIAHRARRTTGGRVLLHVRQGRGREEQPRHLKLASDSLLSM